MATAEVNVQELLFTQDSISCHFRKPREGQRIDDTVESILQGVIKVTDFPALNVVKHEGRLWSLDNRRLWIFKKARISTVTVKIVPYHWHPRFAESINNLELKAVLEKNSFWPRVRGRCRKTFKNRARDQPRQGIPHSSAATDQSLIEQLIARTAHSSSTLPPRPSFTRPVVEGRVKVLPYSPIPSSPSQSLSAPLICRSDHVVNIPPPSYSEGNGNGRKGLTRELHF
ncbi:hypothetical protein AXG93_2381s1020 [Marchantia polymorpha subsp. ruderalis]|uniref:Uncharacterized protein n=1 Tax=Marchantia polymorpha subsp. ruderalis TaxID=1480154 RepID=A0A176VRC1_MARPO|nr:hypothetical protein AXG93_2381s1020 [Marchantia polymorpha subsp. ruderalis]